MTTAQTAPRMATAANQRRTKAPQQTARRAATQQAAPASAATMAMAPSARRTTETRFAAMALANPRRTRLA